MSLIQELVQRGMLEEQKALSLEFEVKNSNRKEEEVILDQRIVSEDFLFNLKSELLKIPLRTVPTDKKIPRDVLELFPGNLIKNYKMVPLEKRGNLIEVGMIFPEDLKAQEALKFLSYQKKFSYQIFLITFSTFNDVLKQYGGEISQALEELGTEMETKVVTSEAQEKKELERLVEEAPVTKIVSVILKDAVEGNASDIHIEPTPDKLRVRFRVLGVLHSSFFLPLKIHPAVIARVKILAGLRIDETRVPQDGRFSTKIAERSIDFRVSILPGVLGEKAAIRILDPTTGLRSFENLGIEGGNLKVIENAIKKPYGLILSVGPTGSGKSTTLYALLRLFNREEVNIVTLEDPVEYHIGGITQSQIKPEINYTFASGLRHILRQDPDIIMVGEIRDEETASLVIHSALTGHIVLSTLHTNDALGVIPRLIDLGVKPYLISPTLSVVMAQRLVRRLCDSCKREIEPGIGIQNLISKEIENLPLRIKESLKVSKPLKIWEAKGCKKCNHTGFSDRIGVFEVLSMTEELSEIISKKPSESEILKEAKRQEMITMRQDGILKVLEGITTIGEVLRVAAEEE